jgi:hypothetical protein
MHKVTVLLTFQIPDDFNTEVIFAGKAVS